MNIDRETSEAFMYIEEFRELPEYSCTNPTGTTVGKIWKAKRCGEWFLREYVELPNEPDMIGINTYPISIIPGPKERS